MIPADKTRHASAPLADEDSEALLNCAAHGGALCTVTRIDGSWSRRLGAQLAVLPDGTTRGSLADGCLEKALAAQASKGGPARILRYGKGSPFIDIRLPCGSGVEVLLDPAPDRAVLDDAVRALSARRPVQVQLQAERAAFVRRFIPPLRLAILGSGPEVTALVRLAEAQGIACDIAGPDGTAEGERRLSLGQMPSLPIDPFTAVIVLFHDHEWERTILPWAMASSAFYIGAQGGRRAREARAAMLAAVGCDAGDSRFRSPVGIFAGARTPAVLALSVLAEVVSAYEQLGGDRLRPGEVQPAGAPGVGW